MKKESGEIENVNAYVLYAAKGKKIESPDSVLKHGAAVGEQVSSIPSGSHKISISDLLENVKSENIANEVFSADVAEKLGVRRYNGSLSEDLKYAAAEKYADGAYLNGNIYINPDLSEARTVDAVLMHELAHALTGQTSARAYASIRRDIFGFVKAADKEAVKYNGAMLKEAWQHTTAETKRQIAERYGISKVNLEDMAANDSALFDEVWAHFAEKLYGDAGVWEYFLGEDKNISRDTVAYWYEAARDYMGDETLARHARGFARKFKKMFEKISEKNAGMNGAAMINARVGDDGEKIKRALKIELEDVKNIRDIAAAHGGERVSINDFTSEDIQKAEKWARKFYFELGTKSPFFRAWFGDWRAYDDKTKIDIADIPKYIPTNEARKENRGPQKNNDTGWIIDISRNGETNTISHAGKNRFSEYGLAGIKGLIENAILLDTETHKVKPSNDYVDNVLFDHKLYALGKTNNIIALYKITVEERFQDPSHTDEKRFHNLKYIEKVADVPADASANQKRTDGSTMGSSTTNYNVAQLYEFVKTYDKEFHPKEVSSALLNEDGTPKVLYHGTASVYCKNYSRRVLQ